MSDKRYIWYLIGAILVAIGVGLYVGINWIRPRYGFEQASINNPMNEQVPLRVGDEELLVEIRDTNEGRALGLSGRETLPDGEGMLFVFDEPGQPVFWMKEMLIGIDIVWIRDGRVLEVDASLDPPTEENPRIQTAVPPDMVEMVLEVPAGYVERAGIAVGDEVVLGE